MAPSTVFRTNNNTKLCHIHKELAEWAENVASQPATEPVFKNPQGVKPSDYELATEIEYLFTAEDDSGFAGLLPFVLFMVDECELPPPLQIGVHDLVAVPVIRSLIPISCSRHPFRSFHHRTRSTLVVGGRAMRANHYFQLLIHLFRKSIKEAFVHCLLLVTTRHSPLSSTTLSSRPQAIVRKQIDIITLLELRPRV